MNSTLEETTNTLWKKVNMLRRQMENLDSFLISIIYNIVYNFWPFQISVDPVIAARSCRAASTSRMKITIFICQQMKQFRNKDFNSTTILIMFLFQELGTVLTLLW